MAKEPFNTIGYLIFGLSILLIGFGLYFKVLRFNNEKLGLTSDDEFSKRIKEKAASKAFRFSIYMWFFVIIFLTNTEPRAKIIIGLGFLGMGLIFFLNWLYYSKVGISDENKN
tara:strand:- start:90689 stop:91027 length:339 start_codon:yes stop_codon:yes gene_type:complete